MATAHGQAGRPPGRLTNKRCCYRNHA
jgi:hypothetical protein